jgi:Bacterial DNA-binding protein
MPPAKGRSPEDDASQTTITIRQMAAELADHHNLSKKQAETLLNDLMTLATKHLKNGHRVRLIGLGVLRHKPEPHFRPALMIGGTPDHTISRSRPMT